MGGNEESMRENRNAIYITMVIALMSLLLASLIEYCECISKKNSHSDFIVNCFFGSILWRYARADYRCYKLSS